jgi:alginate O-acetyltransferase complex protein AlgI
MLFYETSFIFSFIAFFAIYIFARDRYKNSLIVMASYLFYAMWDWRFLSLLILSTIVDYCISNLMKDDAPQKRNKKLLMVSIAVNIGVLAIFKYYNFFAEGFSLLFQGFGIEVSPFFLDVALPAGISFYTFQTLSYTIDVYRKDIRAEKNFVNFAAYVAFFPQLVAGPIERAGNLLVQINSVRTINISNFFVGVRLFGWGAFKKVVIADNLSNLVDPIFANPASYDSTSLIIAIYGFAFVIYCDFSGYSDMARGLAKMIGFDLSINFNLPYFSKNLTEFWRRWHITLSNWIRDYVYIPLGGNRNGNIRTYVNLIGAMTICGLWHGAGLNFIIWGAYNGSILAIERLTKDSSFTARYRLLPDTLRIFITFNIVCFGWLLFRSENLAAFNLYLTAIFQNTPSASPLLFDTKDIGSLFNYLGTTLFASSKDEIFLFLFYVSPLVLVQVFQNKHNNHFFEINYNPFYKGAIYGWFFASILLLGVENGKQFIYFQF